MFSTKSIVYPKEEDGLYGQIFVKKESGSDFSDVRSEDSKIPLQPGLVDKIVVEIIEQDLMKSKEYRYNMCNPWF